MVRRNISIPKDVDDKLAKAKPNASQYITRLVRQDSMEIIVINAQLEGLIREMTDRIRSIMLREGAELKDKR